MQPMQVSPMRAISLCSSREGAEGGSLRLPVPPLHGLVDMPMDPPVSASDPVQTYGQLVDLIRQNSSPATARRLEVNLRTASDVRASGRGHTAGARSLQEGLAGVAHLLQGVASQPVIGGRLKELIAAALERVTARSSDFLLLAQREDQLAIGQDSLVRGQLELLARQAVLARRELALSREEEQVSATRGEQHRVQTEMRGQEELQERRTQQMKELYAAVQVTVSELSSAHRVTEVNRRSVMNGVLSVSRVVGDLLAASVQQGVPLGELRVYLESAGAGENVLGPRLPSRRSAGGSLAPPLFPGSAAAIAAVRVGDVRRPPPLELLLALRELGSAFPPQLATWLHTLRQVEGRLL